MLGATQAVGLFTSLAPKPGDVRQKSTNDVQFANDLRRSEGIAGGIAIALGTVAAIHSKSFAPLLVSGAAVVGLVVLYEYQLRTPPRTAALAAVLPINPGSEYAPVPSYALTGEGYNP